MGQESLNFEEPSKRNYIDVIRINENISRKSDLEQTREIEARESREKKYKYLEDVPNWEEKLKKLELFELYQEKIINKKGFYHYGNEAFEEVRNINDKYGKGTATYIPGVDPRTGMRGFILRIEKPSRQEFDAILDINGSILPSKMEIKEYVEKDDLNSDFEKLQKAS